MTIASDTFTMGYGDTATEVWGTSETAAKNININGKFNLNVSFGGPRASAYGPAFTDMVLVNGGTTASSGSSSGFSMTITGTYTGGMDAGSDTPTKLVIDSISVYGLANTGATTVTMGWNETTAGHASSSSLVNLQVAATPVDRYNASKYTLLDWNPDDYAVAGTSSQRRFTINSAEFRFIDGIKIVGHVEFAAKRRLFVNCDTDDFFVNHCENCKCKTVPHAIETTDVACLNTFVDFHVDNTQVTDILFCINGQNANYDINILGWEPIWHFDSNETTPTVTALKAINVRKYLSDNSINTYQIWIDRARELGAKGWLSVRMNDMHESNIFNSYMHSIFWRNNPAYWREPNGIYWDDHALNYNVLAVQNHQLALITDILDKYDMDGLELDCMRDPRLFPISMADEDRRDCLTGFMAEVKALVDAAATARGHAIEIGVRVPTVPSTANAKGFDVAEWVNNGYIDVLVLAPSLIADFDIPLDGWNSLLGADRNHVMIFACAEATVKAYASGTSCGNGKNYIRGYAAANLQRGADGIYLFNFAYCFYGAIMSSTDYQNILEQISNRTTLEWQPGDIVDADHPKTRSHPVSYHDLLRQTDPMTPLTCLLPRAIPATWRIPYNIYLGAKPANGKVYVRLGLGATPSPVGVIVEVRVNGATCIPLNDLPAATLPGATRVMQFEAPLANVTDGYNAIDFKEMTSPIATPNIVWVELYVDPFAS